MKKSKKQLQETIDWQKRQIESDDASRKAVWDQVAELGKFLDNLLVLEPSLECFRIDDDGRNAGSRWDIEGVNRAVEFNKGKALAVRYSASATSVVGRSAK